MQRNVWIKLAAVSLAGIVLSFAILWGVGQFNSFYGYNRNQYGMNVNGMYNTNMPMNMNMNNMPMNMNMQGGMNMNGGMNMQGGMGMMGGMMNMNGMGMMNMPMNNMPMNNGGGMMMDMGGMM